METNYLAPAGNTLQFDQFNKIPLQTQIHTHKTFTYLHSKNSNCTIMYIRNVKY